MKSLKDFIAEQRQIAEAKEKYPILLYDFSEPDQDSMEDMKKEIGDMLSKYGTQCVAFEDNGSPSKAKYVFYEMSSGDDIIEEYIKNGNSKSEFFKIYQMDDYTLGITYLTSGSESRPLYIFRILKDKYESAFENDEIDEKDMVNDMKFYEKLP